jgi:dihydrofolate reductase
VSRQPDFHVPGAVVVHSIEEAVAACGADEEIFVIGGAELIRSALPLAHRLYLTTVDAEVAGDTYMPHFEPAHWRKRSSERHPADERHPHAYVHTVHERVAH